MPVDTSRSKAPVAAILAGLRKATAESHRRLEARLPFAAEQFNHGAFKKLMAAYYGFYQPLEQELAPLAGLAEVDWPQREGKSAVLMGDLQALGYSLADIRHLPLCAELPAFDSPAALMGVLYVIEGATLGGQVLRARMAEKLGIGAADGGAFLDVYGAQTGRLWRGFLLRLAAFGTDAECAEACAAACQTFDRFETWLEQANVLTDRPA